MQVRNFLPSYPLLGFRVTPSTREDLFELIGHAVARDEVFVIASQNLHGIYTFFRDPVFRRLHEDDAACVHIDGMPIIWVGRLLGLPLRTAHRTALLDWFIPLMEAARPRGWRIFYLGGTAQVLDEGLRQIRQACPGVILGGHHGYFDAAKDSAENRAVVAAIREFRPHVLIVGMGMGRQETWITDNIDELPVNAIATCGACLEYYAGALPTPPRWTGALGIEWAYRLMSDPRRFAWRYLVEPWLTVGLIAGDRLRRRRGSARTG